MITSRKNPRIQRIKRLQNNSKQRHAEGVFVIEGVRLIEEASTANWEIPEVYYTENITDRGKNLVEFLRRSNSILEIVSTDVMQIISDTKSPQGILAVLPMKSLPIPVQLNNVLILDGLRDPGNLGTILRTAASAKVQLAILTAGSVDQYSPKVLRAAMGAHFSIPIVNLGWNEIKNKLDKFGLHIYLAKSTGESTYFDADFRQPLALIIGGEAEGASEQALGITNTSVMIPMPGGGESLNAAVAAGILLFEITRQRGYLE